MLMEAGIQQFHAMQSPIVAGTAHIHQETTKRSSAIEDKTQSVNHKGRPQKISPNSRPRIKSPVGNSKTEKKT